MIKKAAISVGAFVFCALFSMAMFPPGDITRQLSVVATWYIAGLSTMAVWRS